MNTSTANHGLQLVHNKKDRAALIRDRILEAARSGATTRQISSRVAVTEKYAAETIAAELEFASRIAANLEVIFLPAVREALRETVAEARESAMERAA
jgi:hypothetical protein